MCRGLFSTLPDRLTKRAKHGEGAFLNLYQKLFEAPDPAPALSLAFETGALATRTHVPMGEGVEACALTTDANHSLIHLHLHSQPCY